MERAALILRSGGLVAFPTETVYGLGADALNAAAVARIYSVKRRPRFDPLIVHVSHLESLEPLVKTDSGLVRKLAEAFWPGPLSLVLPKKDIVPDIVTAGLPTVAVRIPNQRVALKLIELSGRPIAAPSANLFGRISPTTAAHVAAFLPPQVEMILDGGPCRIGVESTILSLADDECPVLLRPGGVPLEDLQRLVGEIRLPDPANKKITAPGMLPSHYAPRTPLRILSQAVSPDHFSGKRIGLLAFKEPGDATKYHSVEILSRTGDVAEAAVNLFAALHRLDTDGLDLILAESVPETGIGFAVADRLRRAASGH